MSDLVASWEEPGDVFPISVFFAQQPWRLPKASRPQHQFPLCDLRDLCAMLSTINVFSPISHGAHRNRTGLGK
jgi:hypothetical protein